MRTIISIDPGLSGGIAVRDCYGHVCVYSMPPTMPEIVDILRSIVAEVSGIGIEISCIMEKVGMHMIGNSATSSCTFARHCGHLEAALYCLAIPTTQVNPAKWMASLGTMPKEKNERKKHIQDMMQRKYPYLKVTLKIADALGIMEYAVNGGLR